MITAKLKKLQSRGYILLPGLSLTHHGLNTLTKLTNAQGPQ